MVGVMIVVHGFSLILSVEIDTCGTKAARLVPPESFRLSPLANDGETVVTRVLTFLLTDV